jgi:hypothetical protein
MRLLKMYSWVRWWKFFPRCDALGEDGGIQPHDFVLSDQAVALFLWEEEEVRAVEDKRVEFVYALVELRPFFKDALLVWEWAHKGLKGLI